MPTVKMDPSRSLGQHVNTSGGHLGIIFNVGGNVNVTIKRKSGSHASSKNRKKSKNFMKRSSSKKGSNTGRSYRVS